MHRSLRSLLVVLALAFGAAPRVARAAWCDITVATFAFGNYNPFSATATDTTVTITVDCNGKRSPLRTWLSAGGSGAIADRQMRNGANPLPYNIYTDMARTTIFDTLTLSPNTFSLTLYGRIPAGQTVIRGAYTDLLTLTLEF